MAYKTSDLYKKALLEIEKKNLIFISDVIDVLGISKDTFYNHFPTESDESDAIKEAIQKKRIEMKSSIRSKLYGSNSSTALIALYKLLATDEELARLNNVDVTSKGEQIKEPTSVVYNINVRKSNDSNGDKEEE